MTAQLSWALSGLGLVLVLWLVRRRRDLLRSAGTGPAGTVVLAFVMMTSFSGLAASRSQLVVGAAALLLFGYAVLSASPADRFGGADPLTRTAWLLVGLLVLWCGAVDLLSGPASPGRAAGYAVTAVFWVAVGLLAGRPRFSVELGTYACALVLAVNLLTTRFNEGAWAACHTGTLEKCTFIGQLYVGLYPSENTLTIYATGALALSLITFRGVDRALLMGASLVVMLCTGSRTGAVVVAVTALIWAVVGRGRGEVARAARTVFPYTWVPVCWVTAVLLMVRAAPESFSTRGRMWIAVREALTGRWTSGYGYSRWPDLQAVGEAPLRFFHSGYLLVLFAGGVVAAVLLAGALALLLGAESPDRPWSPRALLVVVLGVYSFTEVLWNPVRVDYLSWVALLLFASLPPAPSESGASHHRMPVRINEGVPV